MGEATQAARWHGAGYAQHSGHHRQFDDWFLDRFTPTPDDTVVDLGCGSGEFSVRLASLVHDGVVIGVDQDPSMLAQARQHEGENLRFVQASADRLDEVVEPGSADLVVSRAMLHWIPVGRYLDVFGAVRRTLRPGGWYHSESGGAGNVDRVTGLLDEIAAAHGRGPLAPFPNAGVVLDLLEEAGFTLPDDGVRTIAQRRPFTRDSLLAFLRTQASVALAGDVSGEEREALTSELEAAVDRLRRHDGTYDQTFVRLEILARRPG